MTTGTGVRIRRAFADLGAGQIHYRHGGPEAGDQRPLLMLHSSPGSGRQLLPLIGALATNRRVIAPDTPGHGDSETLAREAPAITDYAAAMLALLDTLGLDRVDLYGSHTGASIAAELAILAPARIGGVILDGIGVFPPRFRDELLANYAAPFTPDLDGAYLMRAFHFLRDQYLFFPWYDRSKAARRDAGLRTAPELHAWLVEILKAAETYHIAYNAAFRWDAAARLPYLTRPTLLLSAQDDPLFAGTREVAPLVPGGQFVALPRYDDPGFGDARCAAIDRFTAAADSDKE